MSEKEYILNNNISFLKEWSEKLNVKEEELKKSLEENVSQWKESNPKDEEKVIRMRALRTLKTKYKSYAFSKADIFEGVVFAVTEARDSEWFRKGECIKALQQYTAQGEPELAVKRGYVKFTDGIKVDELTSSDVDDLIKEYEDENIPHDQKRLKLLYPLTKKDGGQLWNAGKVIRSVEEALVQTIYGVATSSDSEPQQFTLSCWGQATNKNYIDLVGKAVRIQAINKSKKDDTTFILSTSKPNMIQVLEGDSEIKKVLEQHGLATLIEKFATGAFTPSLLSEWAEKEEIPNEYRDTMIIKQAIISGIDPNPSANGYGKIFIEEDIKIVDDANDESYNFLEQQQYMTLFPVEYVENLTIGVGSKVVVIGRGFIGKPSEGYEDRGTNIVLMGSMIIPYKDEIVPTVDVPMHTDDSSDDETLNNMFDDKKKDE